MWCQISILEIILLLNPSDHPLTFLILPTENYGVRAAMIAICLLNLNKSPLFLPSTFGLRIMNYMNRNVANLFGAMRIFALEV